uniref:THO complex subunit 6 n=1 Tax=Tetraselmis sp. GSL018 TaxID=582737 RepID=A0A061QYQ6_9CHLO|mmetsp:Transcript_6769/g.16289  ORF Transcript_6769/g.16289 Transcript_6769/m.16289 type:complete len:350 (+) Transcript_6769:117-1166(+)
MNRNINSLQELDCRCYDESLHVKLIGDTIREQYTTWFCCGFGVFDSETVVAGSSTGEIRVYSSDDLVRKKAQGNAKPKSLLSLKAHHDGACYGLQLADVSGTGLLFSCGDDGTVRVWSWESLVRAIGEGGSSEVAPVFEARAPLSYGVPLDLNSISVDGGSNRVYAGAGDGRCYSWDLGSGAECPALGVDGAGGVLCTALRGDSLACGHTDGAVRLWDARCGTVRHEMALAHAPVNCVEFDSGGHWLAAGCGPELHLWSSCAASSAESIGTESCPQALLLEPNRILVGGDDIHIRRFDFSGRMLSKVATSCACAYGLARSPATGVLAMCGVANRLEILADNGSRLGGLS